MAERLLVPPAVQVRVSDADEDDEEDRVTNPGPSSKVWQAASVEDDDPEWGSPNELARLAIGSERDDETTSPRPVPETNLLHTRPRRTAPEDAVQARLRAREQEREAERLRELERETELDNDRPAPIPRLDAPLFSDEAFRRPESVRPARPPRSVSPRAPRRWVGWLVAAMVALGLAAGLSVLSAGPEARPHHHTRPAEHVAKTKR